MISEIDCRYCNETLKVSSYSKHLVNVCKALSIEERARVRKAIENLFCKCFVCEYPQAAIKYQKHFAKKHPPIEEILFNFHYPGRLVCYCPFHSRKVEMPFADFTKHALGSCPDYIDFISIHCIPPADFPERPEERLNYWMKNQKALKPVKPEKKTAPRIVEAEKKSESIYKPAQGGLCNGD